MRISITWKYEKCTTFLLNFQVEEKIVQKPTKSMPNKGKIIVFLMGEKNLNKEIYKRRRTGFRNYCTKITKSELNKGRY